MHRDDLKDLPGPELRRRARTGALRSHNAGLGDGYVKANVVILPAEHAFDFMRFCQRNPQPCPLLEVTDVGSPAVRFVAEDGDLRTDVPRYRVYERGELVDEPTDLLDRWTDDLVGFLLGCSGTFDSTLLANGVPLRYVEAGTSPPVYKTSIECVPAGRFRGPLVVSMRPMPADKVVRAVQVTSRFPMSHGAPVHVGDPRQIGIDDLAAVDYGEPCVVRPGDVPVFWACGVTPEAAAVAAQLDLFITHKSSHMFVGDRLTEETSLL